MSHSSKIKADSTVRGLIAAKYKNNLPSSFETIRKTVINCSNDIKGLIKADIKNNSSGACPTFMFDEWTSTSNKRFINIILRLDNYEHNLG
ncbi:MAG: hypothetical protein MHPSP_004395, partial [Paramarteilia canceri]